MKTITFKLSDNVTLENTDCTQADVAAIAAYCVLALAQINKVSPKEIIKDIHKIVKGCLKETSVPDANTIPKDLT